jgi:hypothetical protein
MKTRKRKILEKSMVKKRWKMKREKLGRSVKTSRESKENMRCLKVSLERTSKRKDNLMKMVLKMERCPKKIAMLK